MILEHKIIGQSIIKYQVPFDIFTAINSFYNKNKDTLDSSNEFLIGKIKNEKTLFYSKGIKNIVPLVIIDYFKTVMKNYLKLSTLEKYKMELTSIWINEMIEHEYNPLHTHFGDAPTGLSSVMILKLPQSFGKEYSADDKPTNGKLQFIGSASGQISETDYLPDLQERQFYIFPYDLRHSVYPFNGPGVRRTLAANMDLTRLKN